MVASYFLFGEQFIWISNTSPPRKKSMLILVIAANGMYLANKQKNQKDSYIWGQRDPWSMEIQSQPRNYQGEMVTHGNTALHQYCSMRQWHGISKTGEYQSVFLFSRETRRWRAHASEIMTNSCTLACLTLDIPFRTWGTWLCRIHSGLDLLAPNAMSVTHTLSLLTARYLLLLIL